MTAEIAGSGDRPPVVRRIFARAVFGVVLVLLVGAGVAAVTHMRDAPDRTAKVPLAEVDQGATAVVLNGLGAVLVRQGDEVVAFSAGTPRSSCCGDRLQYCEADALLVLSPSSATFDLDGRILGGPAPRGLDRFDSWVQGDDLVVDLTTISVGTGWNGLPASDPMTYTLRVDDRWIDQFEQPEWCPYYDRAAQ